MDDLDSLLAAKAGTAGGDPLDAMLSAQAQPGTAPIPLNRPQAPQPMSWLEQQLAKVPTGLVNNPAVAGARNLVTMAASPIYGTAQLAANALPVANAIPWLGKKLPDFGPVAQQYNTAINEVQAKNKQAETENPNTAITNEFAGGMISPANLAFQNLAGPASSFAGRAWQGAKIGFAGGASAPTETGPNGYWMPKVGQTVTGTAAGAVFAPVMGWIGDKMLAKINSTGFNPKNASQDAEDIISGALKDSGQNIQDIPEGDLTRLKQQVQTALSSNNKLDVAAALRKRDFETLGIKPLQGWVTRDPMQWAEEQNVRGVKGAGEPIGRAIADANQTITRGIGQYGVGASEPYQAGPKVAAALRAIDDANRSAISAEYAAGRANSAGTPEIPLQGLAQDFRSFVDTLPDNVKGSLPLSAFEKYGLSGGTQAKTFTYDDAENLLQTINKSRNNDPAVGRALSTLSGYVKDAISQGGDAGPFAAGRALAAQRFAQHEAIPALEAAASGNVDDNFIQKWVINNKDTTQVQKMAAVLRENNPEAFQEARAQVGAHLYRSAFGDNVAGDASVGQAGFNKALRTLGTGKLEAFFNPAEVENMRTIGRAGSYLTTPPAGAASNYSNTAGTVANILRQMGGYLPVGRNSVMFLGDRVAAKGALNPVVPVTPNLSPEQRQMMAKALTAMTGLGAITLPRLVGEQP